MFMGRSEMIRNVGQPETVMDVGRSETFKLYMTNGLKRLQNHVHASKTKKMNGI
jgi:hypothetical protein